MCEHEFFSRRVELFECIKCKKTLEESRLEQQLAAATKAELAAETKRADKYQLENETIIDKNESAFIVALWNDLRDDLGLTTESMSEYVLNMQQQFKNEKTLREQAEAQCAYWENKCKELLDGR